jgi:6-phosphogluconolactonase
MGGFLYAANYESGSIFGVEILGDGSLVPDSVNPAASVPAGGGPRHIAIHPGGKFAYVVMEMGVSLVCYKLTDTGLKLHAEYPLVYPSNEGVTQEDTAADIHFTKDGTRLYASVNLPGVSYVICA